MLYFANFVGGTSGIIFFEDTDLRLCCCSQFLFSFSTADGTIIAPELVPAFVFVEAEPTADLCWFRLLASESSQC